MTLSTGFRHLASVLDTLEANGLEVRDVTTTDDAADALTVDLRLSVPIDGTGEPHPQIADGTGCLADGGGEGVAAGGDPRPEPTDDGQSAAADDGISDPADDSQPGAVDAEHSAEADETPAGGNATGPDGEDDGAGAADQDADTTADSGDDPQRGDDSPAESPIRCPVDDCDAAFESEHGMKIHRTKVHQHEGDDGLPAYRDPDRLEAVFERCDSFAEMRRELDTDVSAQTVRRQTIAHGIYEPGAGGTSGDDDSAADGESSDGDTADGDEIAPDGPADGDDEIDAIELPEGVTVAGLKAAVVDAKTLYDVQQCFDLERDAAMDLLDRYDLLDVVHGRVSNRDARKDVDEDEITRRILEHAPAGQTGSA